MPSADLKIAENRYVQRSISVHLLALETPIHAGTPQLLSFCTSMADFSPAWWISISVAGFTSTSVHQRNTKGISVHSSSAGLFLVSRSAALSVVTKLGFNMFGMTLIVAALSRHSGEGNPAQHFRIPTEQSSLAALGSFCGSWKIGWTFIAFAVSQIDDESTSPFQQDVGLPVQQRWALGGSQRQAGEMLKDFFASWWVLSTWRREEE